MKGLCCLFILCSVCGCIQSSYLTQSIECANYSNNCKNVIIDTRLSFRAYSGIFHKTVYQSYYIIPIEKLNTVRVIEYNKAIEYERMEIKNENN